MDYLIYIIMHVGLLCRKANVYEDAQGINVFLH